MKHTLKKTVTLLLTLALLLGALGGMSLPAQAAQTASNPFCDIQKGDYFYTPVLWAYGAGITNGIDYDQFGPEHSCTRAQMVTFLWRAEGCPEPADVICPFDDVPYGSYYYNAVLWAGGMGITNGVSNNSFGPDRPCTRGQMATFLYRLKRPEKPGGENPFADVQADDFFYDAVRWAFGSGITTGITADKFAPAYVCTRGQMVTFLYRYYGKPEPNVPTQIEYWTFQELHVEFYEKMAELWNEANPDQPITLVSTLYPFDEMHNKLLIALRSGVGAPDLVDIEIGKYANFLKGDIQLEPLNDIVEPELDNIVKARVDIYSKDGTYYGICYHVGAAVMFYNAELCMKAGIDWKNIKTWDEYYEAAKKFKAANPDKYFMSVESTDIWHMWPQLAELGSDFTDAKGNITINTPEMAKVLEYNRKMVDEGFAIVAPGGYHHAEEFYAIMDKGDVASIVMPMWYIDRFTNYMPDLKGKIAIAPLPVWEAGENRSISLGGTATSITNQADNMDLTKRFLAFAKLSQEGGKMAWNLLGFDPIRTDVWSMEDLTHNPNNRFVQYYANNPFDTLLEIKDEIVGHNNGENFPAVIDLMRYRVLHRAYTEPYVNIPEMLAEEQARLG